MNWYEYKLDETMRNTFQELIDSNKVCALKSADAKEITQMVDKPQETVRDAISRRAIGAAMTYGGMLSAGEDIGVIHKGYSILYETVLPFVTPDVKNVMTKFMTKFDQALRGEDNDAVLDAQPVHAAAPMEPSW